MTEIDQLQAENAELHRYHEEDRAALDEMRATIERLRGGLENRSQDLNRAAMDAVRYADEVARLRTTASDLTPYRRLLARLEADRAGHLRAAEQTEDGRLRDVGSSYAAALHHAATLAVAEFEGAEAAQEYAAKNTKLHQGQDEDPAVPAPADTGLHNRLRQIASRLANHAQRFGDVLDEADRGPWGRLICGDIDELRAVLAVLPAPADLRKAADVLEAWEPPSDEGWTYSQRARYEDGVEDAAEKLRRMADEAQQAEAHASRNAWRVEFYDPAAEEWVPGSPLADLATARARLANARERSPKWKDDDTHVQRRIVRETTTYTVEQQAGEGR